MAPVRKQAPEAAIFGTSAAAPADSDGDGLKKHWPLAAAPQMRLGAVAMLAKGAASEGAAGRAAYVARQTEGGVAELEEAQATQQCVLLASLLDCVLNSRSIQRLGSRALKAKAPHGSDAPHLTSEVDRRLNVRVGTERPRPGLDEGEPGTDTSLLAADTDDRLKFTNPNAAERPLDAALAALRGAEADGLPIRSLVGGRELTRRGGGTARNLVGGSVGGGLGAAGGGGALSGMPTKESTRRLITLEGQPEITRDLLKHREATLRHLMKPQREASRGNSPAEKPKRASLRPAT
tara:strand:+ start:139 stop:1017 length:879 start_codon:yes stop_codon:yes gene_type:complete